MSDDLRTTSLPASPLTGWQCRQCGNCCRVDGYVHVSDDEVSALAAVTELSVHAFTARYTRLTDDRRGLSLTEQSDGACIFLNRNNQCLVNDGKPRQCRRFPHGWSFPGVERICAGCREEVSHAS